MVGLAHIIEVKNGRFETKLSIFNLQIKVIKICIYKLKTAPNLSPFNPLVPQHNDIEFKFDCKCILMIIFFKRLFSFSVTTGFDLLQPVVTEKLKSLICT